MADSLTSLLSGGLLNTNAPNYGKLAASNERKRQGLVDLGLQQINAVFGGGTAPFYTPAKTDANPKFNPQNSYYVLSGRTGTFKPYWAPHGVRPKEKNTPNETLRVMESGSGGVTLPLMAAGLSFGDIFGDRESPRDIARKQFRRGQLFNAPTEMTFEGFQEPFFEKRAQDYVNFALPQFADQYRQNRNSLLFGLSNRGLQDSTVATRASSNLEREAGRGRQTIAETGIQQANQLRTDVENSRQQAINQLYQSADPAQALQGAVRSAQSFQRPSTFAPIANLFSNLAQQYYTSQLLNNYRQPYGMPNVDEGNYFAPIPG